MDFLLFGRRPDLDRWRKRGFWPAAERGPTAESARDVYERVVAAEALGAPADGEAYRRVAGAILRYDVFPRRIIEPVLEREPIALGDVVGATSRLAPWLQLFFASRVIDAFDGERDGVWRTGFTYRTLQGHPELGEETFCVEKEVATGEIRVVLSSWSHPGHWLARSFASRVRHLQVSANRAALDHLERIAASGAGAGQV